MTTFDRGPMPIHWVHRGEIACGVAYRAETSRRRTTDDATKATCAKCIAVQFALVGAADVRRQQPELVAAVSEWANNLPRSGWAASRVKAAFRLLVENTRRGNGEDLRLLRDLPAAEAAEQLGLLLPQVREGQGIARASGEIGPARATAADHRGTRRRAALGEGSDRRGGVAVAARSAGGVT